MLGHLSVSEVVMWGIVVHLFIDWIIQTDWMARNKGSLKHLAAWVHAFSFAPLFLLIFPWYIVLFLCISHAWIDTRKPIVWWVKHVKKTDLGWLIIVCDQIVHILLIAIAALIFCR